MASSKREVGGECDREVPRGTITNPRDQVLLGSSVVEALMRRQAGRAVVMH